MSSIGCAPSRSGSPCSSLPAPVSMRARSAARQWSRRDRRPSDCSSGSASRSSDRSTFAHRESSACGPFTPRVAQRNDRCMEQEAARDSGKIGTKRVLIVEDDDGVREAIETVLMDERFIPVTATNGADALAVLEREDLVPGLIVLDLWMPEMDGAAFVMRLRQHERYRDVPILVVSADWHVLELSESLGAVAAFGKPFDLERFAAAVKESYKSVA